MSTACVTHCLHACQLRLCRSCTIARSKSNYSNYHFATNHFCDSVSIFSCHYTNEHVVFVKLECGPMPNVMAALPNTGGAFCSTPQGLVDTHYSSAVQ